MTVNNEEPVRVRFMCCLQTMPFAAVFDSEGFLICPEHHQRRYGWRSARVKHNRPAFAETRLEQDQAIVHELFGD
jgi:hypothetical protein